MTLLDQIYRFYKAIKRTQLITFASECFISLSGSFSSLSSMN